MLFSAPTKWNRHGLWHTPDSRLNWTPPTIQESFVSSGDLRIKLSYSYLCTCIYYNHSPWEWNVIAVVHSWSRQLCWKVLHLHQLDCPVICLNDEVVDSPCCGRCPRKLHLDSSRVFKEELPSQCIDNTASSMVMVLTVISNSCSKASTSEATVLTFDSSRCWASLFPRVVSVPHLSSRLWYDSQFRCQVRSLVLWRSCACLSVRPPRAGTTEANESALRAARLSHCRFSFGTPFTLLHFTFLFSFSSQFQVHPTSPHWCSTWSCSRTQQATG